MNHYPRHQILNTCLLLLLLNLGIGCKENDKITSQKNLQNTPPRQLVANTPESRIYPDSNTIGTRFSPPKGFVRSPLAKESFAYFLRNLPLKPADALVQYYDQRSKPNYDVYAAVIDLGIGKRDLHQCADAVIRLRADYLYQQGRYDDIQFHFTNGFKTDYSRWRKGDRIRVSGNDVSWTGRRSPSTDSLSYWKYLEMVFAYAGTISLQQELAQRAADQVQIGDVFVQAGSPGHAVIIVDMAKHPETGEKCYLLAQSYMPAQELQILVNPKDNSLSPWYIFPTTGELITPEWRFNMRDLGHF